MNASSDRPNFILITTDQQRFDTIHAAGNPSIFTPHLNWLCDTGIRYSRAYVDCPVCAPSRATIMTGRHAYNNGEIGNMGRVSPMARYATLPGILTRNGYQTHAYGKMHFLPARAHYGFEHMEILPDYYRAQARRALHERPRPHGLGENEMEPAIVDMDERETVTGWTVERSIDFLETRDTTRPFFLWTSFSKPHPPFDCHRSYWDLYDGMDFPDAAAGDWSEDPDGPSLGFAGPSLKLNRMRRFSPQQRKQITRAYYACISQVDYSLGRMFARLREMDLLRNTWIVFTSDHGEMLGDHHLGAKSVFFEGSAHVPLIVREPGDWETGPNAGTVDDRLACVADLLPTFLGRTEARLPETSIDGLDLLGSEKRNEFQGSCEGFHCVIKDAWKFHYSAHGGIELLFNLSDDPKEEKNLAQEARCSKVLEEMRHRLIQRLETIGSDAVQDGHLVQHPIDHEALRRIAWPGFHSTKDQACDMLH